MLFITELRQLTMSVKFACKIRATWKRSTPFDTCRQLICLEQLGGSRGRGG